MDYLCSNREHRVASTPWIRLSPTTLPDGMAGVVYKQALNVNYGQAPYAYTIVSGGVPPGLSLGAHGRLTGFPTVSGTYSFTIQICDSFDLPIPVRQRYTVTIKKSLSMLLLTS